MKTIVGKIYAKWCGHCQSLKPEWQKMKASVRSNSNIQVIEIGEHQQHKLNEFKKQYPYLQVNGYPSIFKIHPNGQIDYYMGTRLAVNMKKWATEKKNGKTQKFNQKSRNTKKNKSMFDFFA